MRRTAVYAGTRNIYGNMAAAAKSLLKNTRMDRVFFLIEDDAFPEQLPDVIRCVNVSGQTIFRPAGPNYARQWTYMALMKLALEQVLPAEEKRVLWLDADTIVDDDLTPLLEMDLEGNLMAAVEEPGRSRHPFVYYNAGVLLMDLEEIRNSGKGREMTDLVNRRRLDYPDQDAINLLCQTRIRRVEPDWNACRWTMRVPAPAVRHFAADKDYGERPAFRQYKTAEWEVRT